MNKHGAVGLRNFKNKEEINRDKINSFNKPGPLLFSGNVNENYRLFKQEINIYFKATKTKRKMRYR